MIEVDFLAAGDSNADAICIMYGDDKSRFVHVVDGAYSDMSANIVNHIRTHYGKHFHINHMVVSHADNDHAAGLVGVMEHMEVKNLWMNRPWLYVDEVIHNFHGNFIRQGLIDEMRKKHSCLVRLEELAKQNGTPVHEVFQGAQIGQFWVLAPSRDRYIRLIPDMDKTPTSYATEASTLGGFFTKAVRAVQNWIEETWDVETLSNTPNPPTSASNESSVVQLGVVDGKTILLTGDVGPEGLNEAADFAETQGLLTYPTCVQVPHHGSRRNVTPNVLDRWLGPSVPEGITVGSAYCSVGKAQNDYPRKQTSNAFLRRGYPVHVTRGTGKYFYHGCDLRSGWSHSHPVPFSTKVEE
jgi:beta-lactamase superfamily II metal-dependent hydrolase